MDERDGNSFGLAHQVKGTPTGFDQGRYRTPENEIMRKAILEKDSNP